MVQVAAGVDAREAWRRCGMPKGEPGIQNIRKRGHALRTRSPDPEPEPPPPAVEKRGLGKGVPAKGYRLSPSQKKTDDAAKEEARAAYYKVHVAATTEWAKRFLAGKTGKGFESADVVAASFQEQLPVGFKLTGSMLKLAVNKGRAGKLPGKRGPKPDLPASLVDAVAGYAQLKQVAGDEQSPRLLVGRAIAAVEGTQYEHKLKTASQRRKLLTRVRQVEDLQSTGSECVDDRRWNWLTSGNLTRWKDGYVNCLHERGFIDAVPTDPFDVITISPARAARMGNADESHQKLSNEGEGRGPRANVYANPKLGRAGKRKVVCSKHASIMAWASYAGECGGLHLMLATGAEAAKKGSAADDESQIRIRPEWTFGVPRVIGTFGHDTEKIFEPSFIMNEKGGMEGHGLEHWVEKQVVPAYPNMAYNWKFDDDGNVVEGPVFMQLDAGPDRTTDCSLDFRRRMWTKGLILFPGLPNGTAANQLMDDLFGTYKTGNNERAQDIVSERIAANEIDPSVAVKLDFCDLGRIINGRATDPDHERPFSKSFTREKILSSVSKLGLNPIDLKQMISHRRVRDNSAEGSRTTAIQKVREDHTTTLSAASDLGININVLTVVAPKTKSYVAQPSTHEQQYESLKANSSVGNMWLTVGAKPFNAPEVTAPAVARVLERQGEADAKRLKAADDYTEVLAEAREIERARGESNETYQQQTAKDLKVLVSFVLKARREKGVAEHSANKGTCLLFLARLQPGEMEELLQRTEPGVAATLALTAPVVAAVVVLPLLMPPA